VKARRKWWGGALACLACGAASAQEYDFGDLSLSLRDAISETMAWRLEPQDARLIYKQNLNPHLCYSATNGPGCYSMDGDASLNRALVAAPGAYFGANRDDGDLNYAQGSLTTALTRLNSQITGHWGDFNFKLSAMGYLDPVNMDKTAFHPDTSYQPSRSGLPRDTLNQMGKDWVLGDALVERKFELWDHDFDVTAGWQHIRWGESLLVLFNSLNDVDAPDGRLLLQPGNQVADIFRPAPAIQLATPFTDNVSLDLVYLFGWDGAQVPYGGSFDGLYDIYTRNGSTPALLSMGQFHEDPYGRQPLPGIGASFSPSTANTEVLPLGYTQKPWQQGQFGGTLSWFLPDLNGGTQLSFYFLNYSSHFPTLSAYATNKTCIKDDTTDIITAIVVDCAGMHLLAGGKDPFPFNTSKMFWDYPRHIQMYGFSFNTNAGKWSLAGELSYRPNLPEQVQAADVLFAAVQPSLPHHAIEVSTTALATSAVNAFVSNPSNLQYVPTLLQVLASPGLLPALAQNASSQYPVIIPSNRDFTPDFLSGYRGETIQPNQYIRGYERLQALELVLTGLRAFGSSENPFGADQVILALEGGAMWFPDMPSTSRLQFEAGDLNGTHASPGADGSGDKPGTTTAPDAQGNGARIIEADGSLGSYVSERYTPTMQTGNFATPFSAGYQMSLLLEYDNLLLGWNFKPQLVWKHDIYGRSPLPTQNFVQGMKVWQFSNTIEFSNKWSMQLLFQGATGGGTLDFLRDKDTAGFSFSYVF